CFARIDGAARRSRAPGRRVDWRSGADAGRRRCRIHTDASRHHLARPAPGRPSRSAVRPAWPTGPGMGLVAGPGRVVRAPSTRGAAPDALVVRLPRLPGVAVDPQRIYAFSHTAN